MYKVTVEGNGIEPFVVEYEHIEYGFERGLNTVYKTGVNSFGRPADLRPNGHSRVLMKLWSGCETWDSFVATGEKWD